MERTRKIICFIAVVQFGFWTPNQIKQLFSRYPFGKIVILY